MPTRPWIMVLAPGLAGLGILACDTLDPDTPGALVPPTVAEDASLPAIEMNGSRFHLETLGDPSRPVVVFLHGGPGGDYRSLLRLADRFDGYSLTDEYFLVYWDQRGAGLSMRHARGTSTVDVYTEDLDALVNRYSPGRPVVLIGESWGGMLATEYINTHGARVRGAVLIEPGPLDGRTYQRLEPDLHDLNLGAEWLNDYAWSSQFLSPDDHARMDYQLLLGFQEAQPRSHIRISPDPAPLWRIGAVAIRDLTEDGRNEHGEFDYDFTTHLSEYATPVLFVTGSRSEVLGEPLQRDQVLLYPAASLVVVAGAGHDVAWTNAPEVLAHVRAYLDTLKGGTP